MSIYTGPSHGDGWFKSSYSNGSGGECVEVRLAAYNASVRDSKHKDGPQLAISCPAWTHFASAVREQRLG
ncbi:DUF397 domain-containing protein [Streptomyces sp. NPDC096176]|uniref:DUF397 domain-containing protein n=1 Tax=Streptomyces sp. NPDC096176 TaxID=3366079 RepID=UPI00381E4F54